MGRMNCIPLIIIFFISLYNTPYVIVMSLSPSIKKDLFIVSVYEDKDFSIFLGDVDTMLSNRDFFGVKIIGGRVSEIIAIGNSGKPNRIFLDEEITPITYIDKILYEFGGYYLKTYLGSSSYIYTAVFQGHKALIHSICLEQSFTLSIAIRNSSKFYEHYDIDTKVLVIDFGNIYLAIILRNMSTVIDINRIDNNTVFKIYSRYPCTSLIALARNSLEEIMSIVSGKSFNYFYRYLDISRDIYKKYFSLLPSIYTDFKQLSDFYYISLYNRLNMFLYPEIYALTHLDMIAIYSMLLRLSKFSNISKEILVSIFDKLDFEKISDIFVGLSTAYVLDYREKFSELCSRLNSIKIEDGVIYTALLKKSLQMCGIDDTGIEINLTLLAYEDILALAELGVIDTTGISLRVENISILKDCWSCLAYTQLLRLSKPQLYKVIDVLSSSASQYFCIDYIILSGFAGLDLDTVDNKVLFKPYIPVPIDRLGLDLVIAGKQVFVEYIGWGDVIKHIKVNSVSIDIYSISLDMLKDYGNEIIIEMSRQFICVELVLLDKGLPLANIPVYIDISGDGLRYRFISITDSSGKTIVNILPKSYLTITINMSIAVLQFKTWVDERDKAVVIDIAKVVDPLNSVLNTISSLEKKIIELENMIEVIRSTQNRESSQHRSSDTFLIFSSLALFASIIALALSLTVYMRRKVVDLYG